jgi:hypothetical protein
MKNMELDNIHYPLEKKCSWPSFKFRVENRGKKII